jgi:putative spermidine/putrescine transport system substrate-binding protein
MMRRLVAGALLLGLVLTGGCGTNTSAGSAGGASASATSECRVAEDAESCGGIDALVRAAQLERELVLPGDPQQNPVLSELAKAFSRKYKVKVTWVMGAASTDQQLELSTKGSVQPDIFFIDPTRAPLPQSRVSAYRVTNFQMISADHRDDSGYWVQDFGGVMAVGYDSMRLGKADSLEALAQLDSTRLAVAGNPQDSADTVQAILMVDASGLSEPKAGAGLAYLEGLSRKGRLASQYASLARVKDHRQNVVLGWNYLQQSYQTRLAGTGVKWKWFVPSGAPITAYHGLAINSKGEHPAAARLWEEYTFSVSGARILLNAGAMPSLYSYLASFGYISRKDFEALPLLEAKPWTATSSDVADVRSRASEVWQRLYGGG